MIPVLKGPCEWGYRELFTGNGEAGKTTNISAPGEHLYYLKGNKKQ